MTRTGSSKQLEAIRPNWIEWLTGLVATLLVLAMMGWILFEAATSSDRPPELAARIVAIDQVAPGWRVMVEVDNRGDQAAAAVEVKATLENSADVLEEATLTFDYVAAGSSARGGLMLMNNPSDGLLKIVPSSFTEP
ncbi:hypothetical protein H6M51_18495 [Rhizobium sp. AQ_MP]|uniref:hypothetical protein n=1 Tax=Rhizobium sp. AQ_MP TaxID=2761536 RepID=UPI00163B1914|nr:hypothetical protein [Rhizobium sp. AQ_MP]MBC2774854.1 hypothetical protein [Rhizobium sp. AQ_MP]